MSNHDAEAEEYDVDEMGTATVVQDKAKVGKPISYAMDVVFGLLLGVLTGFFVYWSFIADGVVLFAWHPSLMAIGFILFMTEANNAYHNAFLLSRNPKSYSNRLLAHWLLHSIAMGCITAGSGAIVYNKIRHNKDHFKTPHAIFGATTVVLMLFTTIGGVAAKYSFELRRKVRPVFVKVVHSFFGLVVYWLGGITLILGLYTKWFEKHRTSTDVYFALAAIVVIWVYTTLRPLGQILRRVRQMLTSI